MGPLKKLLRWLRRRPVRDLEHQPIGASTLVNLRQRAYVSREVAASVVGVSPDMLKLWENGLGVPPANAVKWLVVYYTRRIALREKCGAL